MTQLHEALAVLLIEDAPTNGGAIATALKADGYLLTVATALRDARKLLRRSPPDLLLIDNGHSRSVLSAAAAAGIPAMVLSSNPSVEQRVRWLEQGASDYMVKPIEMRELLLRLRTLARLTPVRGATKTIRGPGSAAFSIDLSNRRVQHPDGSRARLTDAEFRLLRLFMDRPNQILDRRKIGIEINRRIPDKGTRTIDVLVSKLRKKIDSPNGPSIINTVRNAGYVFIPSSE